LVPKILVADDNSNIQKMVGLALKDQGIDVVAVGNGEAAVRKISDVHPDLVLADVFMPVRNGYEVCQFVKTDPALAHIPVILLVGAFDPLDEQEAQRVGADGVLKKPFVPAEPLISMVKSALQRAGVAHGNTGSAKAPEPEGLRATDLLKPGSANVPTPRAIPVPAAHEVPTPTTAHESFMDEAPLRPEPVQIDSGGHPVAFGSLLETPTEETEEDQNFVSATSPEFAVDRDWRDADEEEADEEEATEEPAGWRHEETESQAPTETRSSAKDWRAGGFEQIAAGKSRGIGWEPEEEKPEVVETAPAASHPVTETTKTPPAVAPETTAVPATPFGPDAWAPAASTISEAKSAKSSVETATAVEEVSHTTSNEPTPAQKIESPAAEVAKTEPVKKEAKGSWFSVSPNPWDAELQKAGQLASTWDAPKAVDAPTEPTIEKEKSVETVSEKTKAVIEDVALPSATVEAIREEAAQVAENALQTADHGTSGKSGFYVREEVSEVPAPEPTANLDDLVAKVLAKMRPDVLQAVTREILKPVVEALVKEELKSKKQ
jgi:CheY-like chemotaxis protein